MAGLFKNKFFYLLLHKGDQEKKSRPYYGEIISNITEIKSFQDLLSYNFLKRNNFFPKIQLHKIFWNFLSLTAETQTMKIGVTLPWKFRTLCRG